MTTTPTTLTRRGFAKVTTTGMGALLALGSMLSMTGCTLMDNISNYVGIGLRAFQGVISILSTTGVIPPGTGTAIAIIISMVKAGFADVLAAVTAYENAPAGDKTTLLGRISDAISAVIGQLNNFWSDVQIPDQKIAGLVESLLELIVSTLSGFLTKLPSPKPGPPPQPSPLPTAQRRLAAAPVKRTVAQFKKEYNALVTTGGYPQESL